MSLGLAPGWPQISHNTLKNQRTILTVIRNQKLLKLLLADEFLISSIS